MPKAIRSPDFFKSGSVHLYPKFLKHKHDKIVNLFNNKDSGNTLSELEKISFKKEVTKAKKYEYENDKYVITVPNNSLEVIEEGKALGHCVGGYCRSIAKGHTTILFLRYKVEQSKSFMTLEVNNNVLKQAKKKINRTPNKEEIEFIREWACKKNILIESF